MSIVLNGGYGGGEGGGGEGDGGGGEGDGGGGDGDGGGGLGGGALQCVSLVSMNPGLPSQGVL